MKTLVIAAILLGVPLFAQVAVVSPLSVDGTTITLDASHVMHCTASSSLPTGMTFDGHTLSVPAIDLTGGTATPDGTYTLTSTAGTLTLTPYTPATGSGLTISGQVVTVPSTSVAGFATINIPLAVTAAPAPGTPSVVTLSSVTEMTKGGIFRYSYNVTKAGQVTLTVTSTVSSAQTYGPYTVNASVVQ